LAMGGTPNQRMQPTGYRAAVGRVWRLRCIFWGSTLAVNLVWPTL